MAKIAARGATEVVRLRARSKTHHAFTYLYVLASDGRVLVRDTGDTPSGYSLLGKIMDRNLRNEKTLRETIRRMGREVV